jgi:Xaa-Pro dipeptidase
MHLNKERAYDVMDRHGLKGLVATVGINVFYLSDHWPPGNDGGRPFSAYAVLPRNEDAPPTFIFSATSIERIAALAPTWMPNLIAYSDYSGRTRMDRAGFDPAVAEPEAAPWNGWPVRQGANLTEREQSWVGAVEAQSGRMVATPAWGLRRALKDTGLDKGRVGTDDPRVLNWMAEMGCPGIEAVEATNIFREIRMIKTPPELEHLRKAAQLNEASCETAIRALHEGAEWPEIVAVYNLEITKGGGTPRYLITSLGGLRHGRVALSEPTMFDALAVYDHYLGDFGRIAVVGDASTELQQRVQAMQAGMKAGLDFIKPGIKRRDLIDIVITATRKAGFPEFFYVSPHSIGLEHTDNPLPLGPEVFSAAHDMTLEENMVFNIDMPFFEHGWGTLHIEDTVRVTRNGYEPLTSLDTSLRIIS